MTGECVLNLAFALIPRWMEEGKEQEVCRIVGTSSY